MWYIVYQHEFESGYKSVGQTGGGYYVKYKNKLEDTYSPNWFEAKKYKTLGPALTCLGVELEAYMDSMDKFYEANPLDTQHNRNMLLNSLLDISENPKDIYFEFGRIEKIDENGNLLGNAGEDIINYVEKKISMNKLKKENNMKRLEPLGKSNYIIEQKEGEDFWEGF